MFALRYAFRNLVRHRARTVVTLLGVASMLFLCSLLVSIVNGLTVGTTPTGGERRLITRHEVSLTNPLPVAHWDKIRRVPHVVEASPSSWYGGTYIDDRNFFARFFVDPESFLRVTPELVIPPDQLAAWKADRQGALVSQKLAEKFGWKLGQQVHLSGDIYPVDVDLNIRAIYTGGDDALYFHHVYVDESLGGTGQVGTYTILVDSAQALSPVAIAVDALFADSDGPTKTETEAAFSASFAEMFGNVKGLVTNLTLVIAVTILLTAGNTMAMAVRERTREVAVLKALGFLPRTVVGLVLTESVVLLALAAVVGIGAFWLPSWIYFVAMGQRIPMVWFPLTLSLPLGVMLFAGALGVGVLTGLAPGYLVARRPVVDGLRRQ